MIEKVGGEDFFLPEAQTYPQTLDKNIFLKLFIAQLENQDPLSPMDSKQFITQMAQLSTLEELTNLNANLFQMLQAQVISQAVQLIGFEAKAEDLDTGEVIEGKISGVEWKEGIPYLLMDDRYVPLSYITKIYKEEAN